MFQSVYGIHTKQTDSFFMSNEILAITEWKKKEMNSDIKHLISQAFFLFKDSIQFDTKSLQPLPFTVLTFFFLCCYPKCFWLYTALPVSDPAIEACTVLSALQSKIYHPRATPELFFTCYFFLLSISSLTNTFPASPFHHCQSERDWSVQLF